MSQIITQFDLLTLSDISWNPLYIGTCGKDIRYVEIRLGHIMLMTEFKAQVNPSIYISAIQ